MYPQTLHKRAYSNFHVKKTMPSIGSILHDQLTPQCLWKWMLCLWKWIHRQIARTCSVFLRWHSWRRPSADKSVVGILDHYGRLRKNLLCRYRVWGIHNFNQIKLKFGFSRCRMQLWGCFRTETHYIVDCRKISFSKIRQRFEHLPTAHTLLTFIVQFFWLLFSYSCHFFLFVSQKWKIL